MQKKIFLKSQKNEGERKKILAQLPWVELKTKPYDNISK